VVEGMADWADKWSGSKTRRAHARRILNVEFGGMAEVLYNLAAATTTTSGPRPATDSLRSASSILWPRARDELRPLHANTHIPQVIAARAPLRNLRRHALP